MSESAPSRETSSDAFAFSGFRLGDDPTQVERTVRDRYPSYAVSRAECSNASLQLRVGNHSREDGEPVCNLFGPIPCELYSIGLSKREAGVPAVTSLHYSSRFVEERQTNNVTQELEASYGKPFWQYSMRKSSGWPGVRLESALLWTDRADVAPDRFENEHFANAVYDALGSGKYFIVRLIHGTEDTNMTNGMTVEAFVRAK